jgi:predicted DNA binding CopG/RHH family protein
MTALRFEWDEGKNATNFAKHHVSFLEAQFAFADPHRVIARDLSHSKSEERFYCFGKVEGACSLCGSPIEVAPFASSVPAIGDRERLCMRKKITYTNEPLGDIEVIPDFLPPPAELAFREEGIKVTLALSKKSVDFFKVEASKHQTQYQRMIRRLLDAYVEAQVERPITGRSNRTARKRAAV